MVFKCRPPARKFQNGNLKIVATWIDQECVNVEIELV